MNQVNLIKRGRIFLIVTAAILVGGFFIVWGQVKADLDDVVLNEVYVNSAGEWVEILNPSANAVNINGYKIVEGVGPTATVRTINHDVFAPAQGIVVISGSDVDSGTLNFLDTGDTVSLAKTDGVTIIGSVTYGIGTDLDADDPNKSLQFINSAWTVQAPTKGWFNGDPTISSIVANINAAGVTTNWGTVDIPDSSAATGLYFEKTGYGRVTFNATLNLTDSDTVTFLQDLGNKMDASAGSMKFDARTAAQLKDAGAEIQMYGLDALGFTSTPNLIVKDDNGVVVPTNDLNYPDLDMVDYTDGTLTFTTNHFTQFEVDNNIYVDASASGDKDGTQAHPYNTIQEGVNAAPIGGTVNVAAGIYEFSEQFNIAKPLSIVGQGEVIFKSVNASWSTINGYKHLLGIYAGTMENPVSISNIIFDADGKSHAINTYNNAYGILENVTVKNGKGAGIIVNGSTI
ncbi:MAG: lamin tail domain-containing protein, partial [Patescibacteria group bacterium]